MFGPRTADGKCRQVSPSKRKPSTYVQILQEGEKAYRLGTPNPYTVGTEDHESWQEGWEDQKTIHAG